MNNYLRNDRYKSTQYKEELNELTTDEEFSAKAKEFLPSPDVDSAVVKMDIKKEKIAVSDKELLFKIIKASFAMRRKTLLNSLGSAGIMGVGKKELTEILAKLEISENVRAENLSLEEYVKITECYLTKE